MSDVQPAHIIELSSFQVARLLTTPIRAGGQARHRHPEAASTPCQCQAPEPCWDHPEPPPTAPMAAVVVPPPTAVEALAEAAEDARWAPTVCQCAAPNPCSAHPDDRPYLSRPPVWNDPHPDSPVARTKRRLEHDRAAGVLPGSIDGVGGTDVLPLLTDHELGAWTQALLAEHHRRQNRFADYRRGAHEQRLRTELKGFPA